MEPDLNWANREINAKYITTRDLNVPEQDPYSLSNLKNFMENLSDKELAAFYLAAVNTKSELLAAALVKGHITAEQALTPPTWKNCGSPNTGAGKALPSSGVRI